MEWLAAAVERDLGLDQRQLGPGPRPHELVALVPSRWVMGLRERKVTRCARYEASCETEIPILLQRSQVKLPAGWTRVCIQGLRKNKLGYRLATDPACYGDSLSQDSFIRAMCGVAHSNVRNLWRDAHRCLVQPYAGPVEHPQVQAVDAVRQALQKLFCVHFMSTDRVSPSLSPAREKEKENLFLSGSAAPKPNTSDSLCPNVVPPECLLESGDVLYVILPYTQYSLLDIVSYSPAKLANSHAKVLFVLYQVLIAMRACQAAGLSCGELSLMDIAVDEQLYSRLRISLSHYEELGERRDAAADHTAGKQVPRSIAVKDSGGISSSSSSVSGHLCRDCFDELKCLALDWVHGRVSNFRYLMELNRLAGRREGDPNYHPVLPWVVDFTVPNGKFRDLRRSKFRLNKGDKQLDFTYEMTKEALAAAAAASGGSGGNLPGDLGVSVGPAGAGHADHLHVPHHISDVLSDITYYVYKARQTPKSILCSHVRSQWEPNEYPVSMERMHSWTPDECIPEFFTDPSIFRSIHPDMPDLEVPPWCGSCEEFVEVHRRLLESLEVSAQLHSWIDLTFGYKLSGKEAVKAKNVCLHLVDNHTNLSCYGVVQLFDQPHPPRLAPYQYSPPEPPYLGPTTVPSSWQKTSLNDVLDGAVPETIGSDSASWTLVGRDDDLEQGMEALDSLSAQAGTPSSTTASVPVPLANPAVGKAGLDHPGIVVSPLPGSLPTDGSGGLTNSLGSGIRSAMRGANKKQQQQQQHGGDSNASNPDDFKITLPEGFSPLQPLEELEKRNNFLLKGLRAQIADSTLSSKQKEQAHGTPISLANLFQRDMQALGVLVAEIFCTCKLRGIKSGSPLRQRFQAIMKLCFANLRDIPLPLHHALENLLHLHRHSKDTLHSSYPLLFQYDAICEGLPPPNPWQLLSPALSPLPFPTYFPALHKFIFSYHSKMEAPSSAQGRDIVFHLWQQLETLLQGSITAEGLEILLPFVLSLMLEESTAVYAAWYLFEPVAKVLGPRNATKYLLKPLISVYENPRCLRGRFYLYTDCFVLQLIVRLGLQAFLSCLLSHVLQVITGFEGCSRNAGSNWAGGKALRGDAGLGEDEEEDFECENGTGKAGKGGGGSGAVTGGDPGLADFSSGISLTDQVFLNEGEDFQNGFYVSSTRASGAPGDSSLPGGKQQNSPNFTGKDTDQESLSVGKLSDKSSASEVSLGDADSTRDRASLKSVDSNQDLKQASDGEDGPELEDEEDTVDGKEGAIHRVPSLELTGCLEESGATVVTLEGEGDLLNGMEQGEPEKNMVAEDDDTDSTTEESTEKEHKILLDTVCKTVRWLSAKLGPTVTSRYVARNLLRLLTTCYVGPEKHLFVQPTEESSLESGGSVYEKKPVVGDQTASPVLECLIYVAHLYGEPVLTYQYLPYIGYLVSPPSSHRLNTRKEAGLLAAVVLTQKIIVFLSDTTLMDMLMKINQEVLLPLLHILTSPRMGFPSGVQTRSALCLKTISLMALICLRIGREMVQQHMAQTLCRFFQVFSLLHTLQGQVETAPRREVGECIFLDGHNQHGEEVTWELRVLEELQAVFNPEMAYASYIPFYCLIGEPGICKLVPNYELVWRLGQSYHDKISPGSPDPNSAMMHRLNQPPPIPSLVGQSPASGRRVATSRNPFPAPASTSTPLAGDSLPESGTFGSAMVGNRIQVSRDSETGASPNLDNWSRGHPSHHHHHHHHPPVTSSSSIFSSSSSTSSSTVPSSFSVSSSWVLGGSTSAGEESALKQNLPHSTRALQGNWLAYWQYEIGLNQQDHFHFHQIRLQSFLGHTSTVKCLAPLAGEDYFLSASKDKTVKLWPLYNYGDGTREMEPRLTYMEHRKTVTYVGQLEALQEVVSCDGTLHLWDQFTGKQIRSYEALDGKNPIIAMTTMPAPHCSVVFASADSVLRFIDPRKPGLQHEFRMAYNSMSAGLIRGLAVSPGGSTVAASFSSGFIVLLDVRTGLVLRGWPAHEGDILQMKAAEGNLIVSSSSDHALTVWKDLEQKPLQQYRAPSDPVHTLDLYGSQIVTGNVANKIGVYSMLDISASPVSLTKLSSENFRGTLTSLAVLPTKRLLLLGSENGAVRLLA